MRVINQPTIPQSKAKELSPTIQNNAPVKNQNNGVMNGGHIGDETYNGIKQRHFTQQMYSDFSKYLIHHNIQIQVSAPINDVEGEKFADEIASNLIDNGYSNVIVGSHIVQATPNIANRIWAEFRRERNGDSMLSVYVLTANNSSEN